MHVGETVKLLRTLADMSQTELAAEASITPAYLSQIEAGKKEPSLQVLRELSRALGVSLPLLVAMEDDTGGEVYRLLQGVLQDLVAARLAGRERGRDDTDDQA